MIRTIGGHLASDLAGSVYAQEHPIIDSPLVANTMPQIHLRSIDEAVAEASECVAAGVRTMVDAMPAASGRDPERLARISILTGMRIVATTGLHMDKYYVDVPWAGTKFTRAVGRAIHRRYRRGNRRPRLSRRQCGAGRR
ncbi:MAG TPA: hypothetical protein VE569_02455 [Acidimicrobiia bacterium]|jgi:phosphotriesterase-related protein|nr:hypothetical protein [Acidimicrobiia bacterium]